LLSVRGCGKRGGALKEKNGDVRICTFPGPTSIASVYCRRTRKMSPARDGDSNNTHPPRKMEAGTPVPEQPRRRRVLANHHILLIGVALVLWIYAVSAIFADFQHGLERRCPFVRRHPIILHISMIALALSVIWYQDSSLENLYLAPPRHRLHHPAHYNDGRGMT